MSDQPIRYTPPPPQALLRRILEEPGLVGAVQALPPRALGRLIDHVGLEDAGELVALATTAQLEQIFDEDLWRAARAGEDETFDADRFARWLEVMLEAGEAFTAQKLAELPEELVMLALHRHVLVLDLDALALEMADRGDDDEVALVEKALDGCLYQEIGEYRVISRRHDGWDAIVAVLLALDERDHAFLMRLLDRCCHASTEYIEANGGLYDVLTSAEMLESDAAAEREDRRARAGYVAPSAAAAFLALARDGDADETLRAAARDPMTRAYFRGFAPPAAEANTENARAADAPERLVALLAEAEVLDAPRAMPLLAAPEASDDETLLRRAMAALAAHDQATYLVRMQELSYLGNVLVAGCSRRGGRFRALDAVQAVAATCNLGLERAAATRRAAPEAILRREGADTLFRVGWRLLHTEVALPAARALERLVARAPDGAHAARRVQAAIAAGKPWTARRHLAALAGVVDEATLAALDALVDECPTLPGGEAVFIATARQLRAAQALLPSRSDQK